MRHLSSTAIATAPISAARSVTLQALLAMLLGVVVIGFAGFSHLDIVHNASHDTRHSTAFPCH
jgi:cobalt transporter subunit CbtB